MEWKLNFCSPVATAEFSKFAGILSAARSQHYLSRFEIAQLVPSPPLALFVVMVSKAHLTSHSRVSGSRWVITPSWLSGKGRCPWWRGLTECGPPEKGMANHFSILALRIPWTVWKGKMIGFWKRNSSVWQVPNMLLEISGEMTPERIRDAAKTKTIHSCGFDWW